MIKTVQVSIIGVVQGVGYRAWCEEQCRGRGLSGWVRNRRDGSVEALLSGEAEKVDELLALLWQGPRSARVERVTANEAPPQTGLGFRTLPTA